jgi:predicted aconitase
LLGAAIGTKVLADVPFIVGLDHFLGPGLGEETVDYLREMGAACATYGAVGLCHVEGITPEAVDRGAALLLADHSTYVIDDQELQDQLASYPVVWPDEEAGPEKCLIGCPHLSLRQLRWWADSIHEALHEAKQNRLAVQTVVFAAPQVLERFKGEVEAYERLKRAGVRLSVGCAETLFEGDVSAGAAIITNSNKLRAYSAARFFPDEELVEILVSGEMRPES